MAEQDLIAELLRTTMEKPVAKQEEPYGVDVVDGTADSWASSETPVKKDVVGELISSLEEQEQEVPEIDLEGINLDGLSAFMTTDVGNTVPQEPIKQEDYKESIDWDFIGDLEGKGKTRGYVPTRGGKVLDKSGVTIATGFDLGSRSERDIKSLPESLQEKLRPFLGVQGQDVLSLPYKRLKISPEEAQLLDRLAKETTMSKLKKNYEETTGEKFEDLPGEVQTVMSSVAFQYGGNGIVKKAPKFWGQMVSKDYENALKNLNNFGDKYVTRRRKEGKLLSKYLKRR